MANGLYDKGREGFLAGAISWSTGDIRGTLVDLADYTPNLATDQFYSIIPSVARVATAGPLTGKTITAGVADADNLDFGTVTGDSVEALILWQYNAVESAARLIAFLDTGVGMPFTPSGGPFTVVWDDGANKIFKL